MDDKSATLQDQEKKGVTVDIWLAPSCTSATGGPQKERETAFSSREFTPNWRKKEETKERTGGRGRRVE